MRGLPILTSTKRKLSFSSISIQVGNDFVLPLGGGDEIGASCIWLSLNGTNILVDAGMRYDEKRAFPDFTPIYQTLGAISSFDAFLLTHAHLDHTGAIPKIYSEAPSLLKYATLPTIDITNVMLADAVRIGKRGEDWGLSSERVEFVEEAMGSFIPVEVNKPFLITGKNVQVTPISAGHILGAVQYKIEYLDRHKRPKKLIITGDFCLHPQKTILGASLDLLGEADTVVMESTYAFQPEFKHEAIQEQQYNLVSQVAHIIQEGGRVLIPSFALGRAQEIATIFSDAFEQGQVSPFPVILDGLVRPICEIYNNYRSELQPFARTRPGHAIYSDFVSATSKDYRPSENSISHLPPCCIISSSGMLLEGTRSARYAQYLLPNPKDAIIFSGYVDDETPGAAVLSNPYGAIKLKQKEIKINASILKYRLSAHSDTKELRDYINCVNPTNVILVHGDYHYDGDPDFLKYMMEISRRGILSHQALNGVPIYI